MLFYRELDHNDKKGWILIFMGMTDEDKMGSMN